MLNTVFALTVIAGTVFNGAVFAEPEPPAEAPLLTGPTVSDTNVTGLTSTFSTTSENEGRMMMTVGDPRLFREALLAMREAPEELRLNPEQEAEIAKLLRAFQRSERVFQAKFGPELRRIWSSVATDRRATDRPAQPGEPATDRPTRRGRPQADRPAPPTDRPPTRGDATPEGDPMRLDEPSDRPAPQADARRRAQEIMAQRPNPANLEKPIRAVLTEPQRAWLDGKLAELAKQRFEANAMERYRREAQGQIEAMDQRVEHALADLPPRIRERIEALPPEQRVEALQRLRERREGMRPGDRRGDLAPDAPKTPPTIEEIDVPDPTGGG